MPDTRSLPEPATHIETNAAALVRTAFGLDGPGAAGIDAAAVAAMLARMTGELRWLDSFDPLRRLHAVATALKARQRLMWRAIECWDTARCDPAVRRWCIDRGGFDWHGVADRFVGVGRVLTDARGGWQLAPAPPGMRDGRAVITIPVLRYRPGDFGGVARNGFAAHCIDIIAVDPDVPDKRWRWTCDAGVLHRGDGDYFAWPARARLFATALGWLGAGAPAGGFCIVDWGDPDARELLQLIDEGAVEAVCDDAAYAKWLARKARPKRPKLRLVVAAPSSSEAVGRETAPSSSEAVGRTTQDGDRAT